MWLQVQTLLSVPESVKRTDIEKTFLKAKIKFPVVLAVVYFTVDLGISVLVDFEAFYFKALC